MLQPPSTDYFEFFGLPRNLIIDLKDLEERFYKLSRKWHPDLYARSGVEERQWSLDGTAVLNDAYRVLKNPVARTQYLLRLEGFEPGEQGSKDVPPELLEEMFELNMLLDEEPSHADLEAMRQRFEGMRDSIDTEIQQKSGAWDADHNRETLNELRGLLNRRKYITNLIEKANVPDRV
jgi:molecular chaperone HscB